MKKYSFWKSVLKTTIRIGLVAVPILITQIPVSVSSMTVGGVLMLVFDYLKAKYTTL